MQKRIVVYSISKESTRLEFGAAITSIDPECSEIIQDHATVFQSNMSVGDLHTKLVSDCIDPGDEVWILSIDRPFTGNGVALKELKEFLLK